MTFLTPGSHAKLRGYEEIRSMNVSFSFRTYEPNGLLLYHKFNSQGYVKVCRTCFLNFLFFLEFFFILLLFYKNALFIILIIVKFCSNY